MTSRNNQNPSPLLSEAPSDTGPVLLGGASSSLSEIEQSPLERLIAQSTSEQAAAASSPLFIEDSASLCIQRNSDDVVSIPSSSIFRTTILTMIAGTLCFLQIGLVWASFLSKAWCETHLTITFDGSWRKFSVDQILQTTTMASILSTLLGADQGWAAMILVVTCLICPCLCMILCSSWTFGDYQNTIHPTPYRNTAPDDLLGFNPRLVAEQFMIRICFLVLFLLAIVDVSTSSLALENNHSEFLITNQTRGGLVCYTWGMFFALVVVVMLRVVSQSPFQPSSTPRTVEPDTTPYYSRQKEPRAPPDRVFQSLHRPLLADDENAALIETNSGDTGETDLAVWKKILLYEVGILTWVLWFPALFLPIFQVHFDGLVASFMDEVSLEVPFYALPAMLGQRGIDAGTDPWIMFALGVVLLLLAYVFPLVTTAIAIGAWRSPNNSKAAWFYKAILRYLQPTLCGPIFALSVFLTMPALKPIGEFLLDTQTSGFCQRFENMTSESCLAVHGQSRLGVWFLLAQSLVLEIFVVLTLMWKR